MEEEGAQSAEWKIPLAMDLLDWIGEHASDLRGEDARALELAVHPHIQAAEQRGREAAEARLDVVRELHANDGWHCGTCADEFGSAAPWPCPTAVAVGLGPVSP